MRVWIIALCAGLTWLSLPAPGFAQDRDGNDTPGEWVVDHYQAFGLWDSICDYRVTGETREERCYIRYVEAFAPHPNFAAQFVFITPGPQVEFGIEPGTFFADDGFRIDAAEGKAGWAAPQAGCLVGLSCLYEGAEARTLLDAMAAGGTFAFDFIDRNGDAQALRWDLSAFGAARDDFDGQVAARGLTGAG
ncbi:MAG: hypothetical protein AAF626_09840 [Pseudomonadota bacterium]